MAGTRRQTVRLRAALSKLEHLKAEVRRLEALYRQSVIERVIDLEIVGGIHGEKDRTQESLKLRDPRKYSLEALEHFRKGLVAILAQRNHPPEESMDQRQPQGRYIQ